MTRRARARRTPNGLPRPTVRGWAFLGAAVLLFVATQVLDRREIGFVASLLLALPLLALALVSIRRPRLSVARRFTPETSSAGDACTATLAVQNWGAAPTPAAVWFDDAAPPLVSSRLSILPSLTAFRSYETDTPRSYLARYVLATPHRGIQRIGPFVVRLTDPFGLAVRELSVGGTDTLTVIPSVSSLGRGLFRLPAGDGRSQQSRRLSGSGEQDVIARKYQTGDSMRRVHWPATARHSELMVRQDDQHNDHEAVVLLDSRASSYRLGGEHPGSPPCSAEFEWAVSMSASIGLHLLGEGFRVRLLQTTHHGATGAGDPGHREIAVAPGGHEDFLLRAARFELGGAAHDLDLRGIVSDSGAVSGELPPVFAVLGQLSGPALERIARAALPSSAAVAFIVVPGAPGAPPPAWAERMRELLDAAGWAVRVASSAEPVGSAWHAIGGERVAL